MQTISDRIQQRMKELGKSQADIHRSTGAGKATISSWISGATEPSGKYMYSLSALLECSTDWLISGRGEIKSIQNQINNNNGYIGGDIRQSIDNSNSDVKNSKNLNHVAEIGFYPMADFNAPKQIFYATNQLLTISPTTAIATIMCDDFMQPVIREKSLIIADITQATGLIYVGKIYLLNMGGLLVCRYLQQMSGNKIKIFSEKDQVGDIVNRDDFEKDYQIIGRVVSWISFEN